MILLNLPDYNKYTRYYAYAKLCKYSLEDLRAIHLTVYTGAMICSVIKDRSLMLRCSILDKPLKGYVLEAEDVYVSELSSIESIPIEGVAKIMNSAVDAIVANLLAV